MGENKGFTKTDMERLGIFSEMQYATIGDRYKPAGSVAFNTAAGKGKQMLPGGSKEKSAQQHGYFNQKFDRVLEGEASSDPIKRRRQHRMKEAQKNIGKPFLPSNGDKKPSGLGNHFGTIGGPVKYFNPQTQAGTKYQAQKKNFYTNPGKKGTGYGYVGITLNPYQKYASESYQRATLLQQRELEGHRKSMKGGAFRLNMHPREYFNYNPFGTDRPLGPPKKTGGKLPEVKPFKPSSPAKKPGNNHSGTFDPYPTHSVDAFGVKYKRPVHVVNSAGKTFMPSPGPKSAPINSVINQNVIKKINKQNFKTIHSVTAH